MSDDPLIGRRLANFKIERPLGRGGMAQVYYGQDIKLNRAVAIKVIDTHYRDNPTYAQRFLREAQTIANWHHENIIQIYYADVEDGLYYYVMEYIDSDLEKLLAQAKLNHERLPVDEVLHIGRSIAAALDYAHSKQVIHRDVKPSNVLIDPEWRVVLTDFGLALEVENGSLGEAVGSPHYVAPEQAHSSASAVPQSDLYALGIILYQMLAGRAPFIDSSAMAVAVQHMQATVPQPRQFNPALNRATETVLLKALSKKPADRYPTGQALMEALEAALYEADEATVAHVDPPAPAAWPAARPAPRSLLYIGLGAVLAALLVIFLAGLVATLLLRPGGDRAVTTEDATNSQTPVVVETAPPTGMANGETSGDSGDGVVDAPPTAEPTPSATLVITPTAEPTPEVLADTGTDFSGEQTGPWRYTWSAPGTADWQPLKYEQRQYGLCWYAEDYVRLCPGSAHPGNGAAVAYYWTSPTAGPLEIRLIANKKDLGGDGVVIAVYYNTLDTRNNTPIFQRLLAGTDQTGFSEQVPLAQVEPGDSLLFVISHNGNALSDHTLFRARVCRYYCP
jgi:tRNA A-37 threonylcarbamoyl transferase component Bud32